MKALVINLNSATERMAFQQQQLDHLGISFERIPATSLTQSDERYKTYYKTWERTLSPAEVGCFFSHKNAWEYAIEKSQPILILEDDAYLTDGVMCILKESQTLKNIDYITLEVTGSNKRKMVAKKAKFRFCDVQIYRLYQGRSGAGGYILWPSGAKILLDKFYKTQQIGLPDIYINRTFSLSAYQIEPAVIIQLDQCKFHNVKNPIEVKSTISTNIQAAFKKNPCFQCKIRRLKAQFKIAWNQLLHLHHSTKRQIMLSSKFPKN